MKKNIVFIVDIDLSGEGRWASSRRTPYEYSIKSWKHWCNKNNCELFILTELLMPHEEMGICWQRYYLFDILEANEIEYDQVLMVDADTIVHPDCPNLFEMSDYKFTTVHNDGSYDWVLRSIENYSKFFFEGFMMPYYEYFDCGFMIVNKNHKKFFENIVNFYHENKNNLQHAEKQWHVGTDQTPVNFLIHKHNIELKLLPYEFNMIDLHRKELLTPELPFTKIGYVYQYNGIPNNKNDELTLYWMKRTYEELYEN
jgi:lipopolysaccharide biosynthesis glycosyltransferase